LNVELDVEFVIGLARSFGDGVEDICDDEVVAEDFEEG